MTAVLNTACSAFGKILLFMGNILLVDCIINETERGSSFCSHCVTQEPFWRFVEGQDCSLHGCAFFDLSNKLAQSGPVCSSSHPDLMSTCRLLGQLGTILKHVFLMLGHFNFDISHAQCNKGESHMCLLSLAMVLYDFHLQGSGVSWDWFTFHPCSYLFFFKDR